MPKIDELIAQLCPEGVAVSKLDDLGSLYSGLSGKSKSDFTDGNAPFVSYLDIGNFSSLPAVIKSRVKVSAEERQNTIQIGDLLFTGSSEDRSGVGLTSEVEYAPGSKTYLNSFCFGFRPDADLFAKGYLKHLFRSREVRISVIACSNGVTRINISKKSLVKIEIPVPPLEVQREIVSILDKFTQLEAELEAELEARRIQYGHYRDTLLTFSTDYPMVPMHEIAEVRSGWGFPNVEQGASEGDYPFYKVSDMNLLGNETVMDVANNYISEAIARKLGVKPAPAGTIVFPKIGAAVATNKKRLLSTVSAYDNNVMGLIPGPRVSSRFLYYWMQTFDLTRLAHDSGAVPSIRKSEAEQVLVPLPPLVEQERIVAILDKLDALVNDLSIGLPAELAARRKQYEYFRNKLLTFKELEKA